MRIELYTLDMYIALSYYICVSTNIVASSDIISQFLSFFKIVQNYDYNRHFTSFYVELVDQLMELIMSRIHSSSY